jgi:LacI family transcriptional regulator
MVAVGEVAQRAGVSTSTVSHVLNGTRFVSAELRARVQAAVEDLDYQPNAAARSLSLKRSNAIGLIVADIRNPFYASVARGAEDVAQAHGYKLVLCNTDQDATRESVYLQALQTRQVDGALVASGGTADAYLARLIRAGLPVVLVDRDVADVVNACAIVLDKTAPGYAAVRYLLGHGHRRIAMLAAEQRAPPGSPISERTAGYRRALAEVGFDVDERLVVAAAAAVDGGRQAAGAVLDVAPPPTAIFSDSGLVTLGVLESIASRGLRVPEDVEIVSADDLPQAWAEAFDPRVSTVAEPTYQLGCKAAEMLVSRLRSSSSCVARVVFQGAPLVRESVAPYAWHRERRFEAKLPVTTVTAHG